MVVFCHSIVAGCLIDDNFELAERLERRLGERAEGVERGELGRAVIVNNEAIGRVKQGSCLGVDGAAGDQEAMEVDRVGRAAPRLAGRLGSKPFLGIIPGASTLAQTTHVEKWLLAGSHIEEYSQRRLSFGSDAMNAFLGTLRSLGRAREPILYLWGVLLWPIPGSSTSRKVRLSLNGYHKPPVRRRAHFPTWSWAAWDGPARMSRFCVDVPSGRFSVEGEGDGVFDINDFVPFNPSVYQRLPSHSSCGRHLQLHTRAIKLAFEHIQWSKKQLATKTQLRFGVGCEHGRPIRLPRRAGIHAVLPRTTEVCQLVYVHLNEELSMNDLMKDEILGMTITHNLEVSVPNEGWAIMLVRSRQEFYERVGLLHVDQIRDNPGRLPFTAFRTSPGEIWMK
jgi:hypothetical protein